MIWAVSDKGAQETFAQAPQLDVAVYLPLTFVQAERTDLGAPEPLPTVTEAPPSATPTGTPPSSTATTSPTLSPSSTPTPSATVVPTETAPPTVSPTATTAVECEDVLFNGDFEEGSRRWDLESTYRGRSLSQIIIQPEPNTIPRPVGGDWIAALGGGRDGGFDQISQPHPPDRPWQAVPAEELISATLRFHFTAFHEGTLDRRPDDILSFLIIDIDSGREYAIEGGELSEEDSPSLQEWESFALDVTRQMAGRQGERRGIDIRSKMRDLNDGVGTRHFLDEMSLVVCRAPGSGTALAESDISPEFPHDDPWRIADMLGWLTGR